jgi:hypothetical protein
MNLIRFTIVIILLSFISCSRPVYRSNVLNTPLMREAKQKNIGLHAGSNGFDLHTAYAIDDKFALMANGSVLLSGTDSTGFGIEHSIFEGALGYYKPINEKLTNEIFLGFGKGQYTPFHNYPEASTFYNELISVKYSKFFLQYNLGISQSNVDFSFCTRISLINYNLVNHTGRAASKDPTLYPFFEPALNLRYGRKNFKITHQLGFCASMDLSHPILYSSAFLNFSTGIFMNLELFDFRTHRKKDVKK